MSPIRTFVVACIAASVLNLSVCTAETKNKIPVEIQAVLEEADQLELLLLDPDYLKESPKDGFHHYKVLGKTTVKDKETKAKLVAAFKRGVEENKGIAAACFEPHHGIRVTHDRTTIELVVCFRCYQVVSYVNDKSADGFLITASPEPVFGEVLVEAGVLPHRGKARKE